LAKEKVWTKRCDKGEDCVGATEVGGYPYFVPDDIDICEPCIKSDYNLWSKVTYDGCGDPYSIIPLIKLDDAIEAIRRARKGE
jgi:hypothetical protein